MADEIEESLQAHFQAKGLIGRQDELQKAGDHWWNCDGTHCEFADGSGMCGYDDHRRADLQTQLQQLKNGES